MSEKKEAGASSAERDSTTQTKPGLGAPPASSSGAPPTPPTSVGAKEPTLIEKIEAHRKTLTEAKLSWNDRAVPTGEPEFDEIAFHKGHVKVLPKRGLARAKYALRGPDFRVLKQATGWPMNKKVSEAEYDAAVKTTYGAELRDGPRPEPEQTEPQKEEG